MRISYNYSVIHVTSIRSAKTNQLILDQVQVLIIINCQLLVFTFLGLYTINSTYNHISGHDIHLVYYCFKWPLVGD